VFLVNLDSSHYVENREIVMNNVAEQLIRMQVQQYEHDEFFHKEITRLNIHQRLNHMALHFAKYAGKICDCVLNTQDEQILKKNIIDSFIISTTCANTLNIRIVDKLSFSDTAMPENLLDLGRDIANQLGIDTEDSLWLVKTYPVVVGELAKACESVDHLESYPYRETIADCVIRICSLMLVAASQQNIDLVNEVSNRLTGVKQKSIFFDYYMSRQT
jgi:hypothetical protein